MAQLAREVDKSRTLADPAESRELATAGKSVPREYAEAMGIALLFAIVIRTFLVQAYKIPSGSMEPTLLIGDHIMVNKIGYGLRLPESVFGIPIPGITTGKFVARFSQIKRGEVVVFVFPPDRTMDFIKRVVGIPGDTVEVKNGGVWLNGKPMDDPHGHFDVAQGDRMPLSPRDNFGPVTVPDGKIFMMGDNRDHSYDSRFWGFADQNDVEGRAMFLYGSWGTDDGGPFGVRWDRFGRVVH
jgi:signal peptidase I